MPYCPQCRAEYIEGITACRKCGVPLVAELPEPAPAPSREVPARLRPLVTQFAAGWGYAMGAARLLWRRPGLLWLPVLIALFNVAERDVGQYAMLAHTSYGRNLLAQVHSSLSKLPSEGAGRTPFSLERAADSAARRSFRTTVDLLSSGSVRPDLTGAASLLGASLAGTSRDPFRTPGALYALSLLAWLLSLALAAATLGGYYSVLNRAAAEGTVQWGAFGPGARRYGPRIAVYCLVLLLIALSSLLPLLRHPQGVEGLLAAVSTAWEVCIRPLLLLTVVMMPVAVVVGDARAGTAFRRSIATIWRRLPVSAVLVLLPTALCWVVLLPYEIKAELHWASALRGPLPSDSLKDLPLDALQHALLAVIATWAVLALFLWYREAYPAPASCAPDGVAPTEG